jgi:uncharacterized membrane protein YqhA
MLEKRIEKVLFASRWLLAPFVVSAVTMGLLDRISFAQHREH